MVQVNRKKEKIKKWDRYLPIMKGLLISILASLCSTMVCVYLINSEIVSENASDTMLLFVWGLPVILGSVYCVLMQKTGKLLSVSLVALGYFLILSIINILIPASNFEAIGKGIRTILVSIVPSVFMILKKPRQKTRKMKYRI